MGSYSINHGSYHSESRSREHRGVRNPGTLKSTNPACACILQQIQVLSSAKWWLHFAVHLWKTLSLSLEESLSWQNVSSSETCSPCLHDLFLWSSSAAFLGIWTRWSSCIFDVNGIHLTSEYDVVTQDGRILCATKSALESAFPLPIEHGLMLDWAHTSWFFFSLEVFDSFNPMLRSFAASWVRVSNSVERAI